MPHKDPAEKAAYMRAYRRTPTGGAAVRRAEAKYDASLKGYLRSIKTAANTRQAAADQLPDTITILGDTNGNTE